MIESNVFHGLPRRIGTYWGGFAGETVQAADWHSMVDATTERFRGYLSARLDQTADVPQEVGDRLREWIEQDANLWALSQWLDTGKGWETEGLGEEVEKVFAAAVNGARRRFWLARLEAAAQRNRDNGAAALLKDPAQLDRVLAHLADPRKPLTREPTPYKVPPNQDEVEVAMFMAFPGLKEGDEVPDFCRVRPTVRWRGPYPDPLPPHWVVHPALALRTLKGVLGWNDWWLLQAFISDEPGERWLRLLAWAWLDERRARALEAHNARPFAIQPRNVIHTRSGADFLRFPSLLKDAASWCQTLVEIPSDGTVFGQELNLDTKQLKVYQPQAWAIAPERVIVHNRQLVFPGLSLDPERNQDLGLFVNVAATDAAATDPTLPGVCVKLVPLLFALCPLDGGTVAGSYQDLVKLLWPNWKERKAMPGDCKRTAVAAAAIRPLKLVELRPGCPARVFPLFGGGYYDASPDGEVSFSLNPSLLSLVRPEPGAAFMLVNLSRLMELDAKSASTIAVAQRLFAYWHTCKQGWKWRPERVGFLNVDDLIITATNVEERVARVLAGDQTQGNKGRRAAADARAKLLDKVIPTLQEARILGQVEIQRPPKGSRGKDWLVKPFPQADYVEACRIVSTKRGTTSSPRRGKK